VKVQTVGATDGYGFIKKRAQLQLLPGSDEMWETLTHEAILYPYEADELVDAIRRAGEINLEHWVWTPSRCTPIGPLQVPPTAKLQQDRIRLKEDVKSGKVPAF
jgi:hypothetical protein